jgi:hypothetical protein
MQINSIKRPWERQSYTPRRNKDQRYQSKEFKQKKVVFKQGFTKMPDGKMLSNQYCYDCYIETGKQLPGYAVDHNTRVKDGAEFFDMSNWINRCESHHNSKSAREGNDRRKKP